MSLSVVKDARISCPAQLCLGTAGHRTALPTQLDQLSACWVQTPRAVREDVGPGGGPPWTLPFGEGHCVSGRSNVGSHQREQHPALPSGRWQWVSAGKHSHTLLMVINCTVLKRIVFLPHTSPWLLCLSPLLLQCPFFPLKNTLGESSITCKRVVLATFHPGDFMACPSLSLSSPSLFLSCALAILC